MMQHMNNTTSTSVADRYRITPRTTTGISPSQLLTKRRIQSQLDLLNPILSKKVLDAQNKQRLHHDYHARDRTFRVAPTSNATRTIQFSPIRAKTSQFDSIAATCPKRNIIIIVYHIRRRRLLCAQTFVQTSLFFAKFISSNGDFPTILLR